MILLTALMTRLIRTTIDTNYYGTRHVTSQFMPLLRDHGTRRKMIITVVPVWRC